jgi:Ser-tRNA(Ala) deacylase AlaX
MSIFIQNPTNLIYLNDTYLFEGLAQIVKIFEHESQTVLILDQTIFYPQGGGQPSDIGFIINQNGKFEVTKTVFEPSGQVWHLGNFISGNFEISETVKLEIDKEKRVLNSKNHSAGHLIDLAIESLNLNLEPAKGYHFPVGAYVEYSGDLNIENTKFAEILEQKVNEIIQENPKISFEMTNSKHESGKPERIMHVEGYKSCPCGGTHIKNLAEIGQITIKKVKKNKGNIRISYQLENKHTL